MRPETEYGEWQVDPGTGKRFREVDYGTFKIKEYEMEYSNGLTQSQLHALHEAEKDKQKFHYDPAPPARACPFTSGIQGDCRQDACALYDGEACTLARIAPTAATDTAGRKCPFNPYPCNSRCSLYSAGCVLTNLKPRK